MHCTSLTTVSFPTTLTSIGWSASAYCRSLENVDLLHTNVQEIGFRAFAGCSELKSMTIPDSLQTIGKQVFHECLKLVPSTISLYNNTSEVIAHLCAQQNASVSQVEFMTHHEHDTNEREKAYNQLREAKRRLDGQGQNKEEK